MTLAVQPITIGGFFSSLGGIIVGLLSLAIALVALFSILTSDRLTGVGKLVWAVVVLIFPLVGSLVWFLWGSGASISNLTKD